MQVTINGKIHHLEDGTTVHEWLEAQALAGRRIALEINGEILPKRDFAKHQFCDGDVVELVGAVGGG